MDGKQPEELLLIASSVGFGSSSQTGLLADWTANTMLKAADGKAPVVKTPVSNNTEGQETGDVHPNAQQVGDQVFLQWSEFNAWPGGCEPGDRAGWCPRRFLPVG